MVTFDANVNDYDATAVELVGPERGWRIDPARAALLVHDLLPYYVGVLPDRVGRTVVDQTRLVVEWAREHGVPVFASAPRPASHIAERGLGGRLWGLGPSAADARTSCLPDLLGPGGDSASDSHSQSHSDSDTVPASADAARRTVWIAKRSYSAFFATDLAVELRRLGRDQLIVAGVFASAGILATTFDALANDVEAFVVAEATADYDRERHAGALEQIRATTGEVVRVSAILRPKA